MKIRLCILTLCLIASLRSLRAADESPIVFARSGQKVLLRAPIGYQRDRDGPLELWAFDKSWGEQTVVKDGKAEFIAPSVRTPITFGLRLGNGIYNSLVVYPDRPIPWDKNTECVVVGPSDWFSSWIKAMDLPVEFSSNTCMLEYANWHPQKKRRLLILDSSSLCKSPIMALNLAARHGTNVLWFGVDWYGCNNNMPIYGGLSPKQMVGPFSDFQGENWHVPPEFCRNILQIVNRQTWIAGPENPWVEEIRIPKNGMEQLRVVGSYLPWQQQLGQNEVADLLFLRLLTETAKGAEGRNPLNGRWRLLYPAAKKVPVTKQPVLAAAMKSAETTSSDVRAYVLDLSGKASPSDDLFKTMPGLATIESRIGKESSLLILGDHPILETWKWLQADRREHCSPRPGVVWLPNKSLPPSMESQLRLMQLFTEWNIPLENNFTRNEQ